MPRRQYEEVRILAEFHTPPGSKEAREAAINNLGDRVFDSIRKDSNHRFHFMLNGAGTFSEMSLSLLAAFKSSKTRTSKPKKSAQRIINPNKNQNVTPLTKELTKTPEAKIANSLPPRARETKRVVERAINPKILVGRVDLVEGVRGSDVPVANFQTAIKDANKTKTSMMDILPALYRVVQRMYSKCRSVLSAKNDGSGGHFSRRGRALAEFTSMQALDGKRYVPALLLFRDSSLVETISGHITKDKMHLGSIMEVLIYVVAPVDKTVADMGVLDDVFIVCKTCASGSFGGNSKMDIAVLFDILSKQV